MVRLIWRFVERSVLRRDLIIVLLNKLKLLAEASLNSSLVHVWMQLCWLLIHASLARSTLRYQLFSFPFGGTLDV